MKNRFARWIAGQAFFSVAGMIYGTTHVHLPTWAQLLLTVVLAAAAAGTVASITWWTRTFRGAAQTFGTAVRTTMWLAIVVTTITWMADEPKLGVIALGVLIYHAIATSGGDDVTGRAWRWIRREHLAPRSRYADAPAPAATVPAQRTWQVAPITAAPTATYSPAARRRSSRV